MLRTLERQHPRLLCREADFAAIKAEAAGDPLRQMLIERVVTEAQALLADEPLEHRLIGPRMLDQSRLAVRRILTCAMAFRLRGDVRFAARARTDMLVAAGFADWNPSHFLDAGEMAFALAVGYDWLQPQLAPDDRGKIKRALMDKALSFVASAYAPGGFTDKRLNFVTKPSNWNQVCNGGLIAAALAIADEEPALAEQTLRGALQSVPYGLAGYAPDGAYPEGPSYWNYGTTYTVITIAMLESALGKDFGLSRAPGFDRTAAYFAFMRAPSGDGFNYADAIPRLSFTPTFTWLARRFPDPALGDRARAALEEALGPDHSGSVRDRFFALHALWFPPPRGKKPDSLPLDARFRGGAETAVFRSDWNDERALFVGFKAGSNHVNHAHLDLGSFVLEADGVRWALDLGRDDYNLADYFGPERWSVFRLNNLSHNTIGFGNDLQPATAVAPIIRFASTAGRALAVADLSAALQRPGVRATRAVAMLDRARVLVQDDLRGLKNQPTLSWRMFTKAAISLYAAGSAAMLRQDSRTMRVEILSPADAAFTIRPAAPPTAKEDQNVGVSVLAIEYRSTQETMRLAVVFTPVGAHWPILAPPPPFEIDR